MNRRLHFILGILLLGFGAVNAQSKTTYTRYGVGDVLYSYSARTLSMGHSGSALINKDYVEILNPASWSSLSRTRIEFSFVYQGLLVANSSDSKYYSDGEFKGFTFAFPVSISNGIGVAMGLVPYSRVNYLLEEKTDAQNESGSAYTTKYVGKGGLSKIFIGGSYKLPFDLIMGATLEYYFGNLRYTTTVEFDDASNISAEYELLYAPTGFGTTVGLISPDLSGIFNSENISDFRLSFSANAISKLETDTSLSTVSSSISDTLGTGFVKMKIPFRVIGGATLKMNNKFIFALDYFYQPWSYYSLNDVKSNNLKDAHKVSLGFEYRPIREPGMSFWEQIMLRAGLSYEQSQYTFNNTDLNQYSIFAGFSLPLSPENTIDFAFEYSSRGTTDHNLIKEDFFKLNLGISFGDIWFQRYEK